MKYVDQMGYVYRLTDLNYRRFLSLVSAGQQPLLDEVGAVELGRIRPVTDITPDMAKDWLEELNKKPIG
jgi:hypothetical protein